MEMKLKKDDLNNKSNKIKCITYGMISETKLKNEKYDDFRFNIITYLDRIMLFHLI